MTTANKNISNETIIAQTDLAIATNGNTLFAAFSEAACAEWTPKQKEYPFWNTESNKMNVSKARGVMSALLNLMGNPDLKIGLGFALNGKEILQGEEGGTVGYCIGARLLELFPGAEVIGDVEVGTVYRLTWESWNYMASPVKYIKYEEGEGDEPKYARRALRLFEGYRILFAAYRGEYRVKLAWKTNPEDHSDDYQPLVDYTLKMYAHFVAGETDAIEEMRTKGFGKARVWAKTGEMIRKQARGVQLSATYIRDHNTGKEIPISEKLVGRTFDVYGGSVPLFTTTFRELTWEAQANAIANNGNTVVELK